MLKWLFSWATNDSNDRYNGLSVPDGVTEPVIAIVREWKRRPKTFKVAIDTITPYVGATGWLVDTVTGEKFHFQYWPRLRICEEWMNFAEKQWLEKIVWKEYYQNRIEKIRTYKRDRVHRAERNRLKKIYKGA